MSDLLKKFCNWSYHRQHLGKQETDIELVLKDIIGVYSSHPTAPLALHARVRLFGEKEFYKLDEQKLALRVPAMRLTIHMLPRETAHLAFAATVPPASDPVWQKRYSNKARYIPPEDYEEWQRKILQVAVKPITATEIKDATDIPDDKVKTLLNFMAYTGYLLRVGAKSLRSDIISYVSTQTWAGGSFKAVDNEEALAWLAGEYLRAFGPASVKDFQWWAGITAGKAKAAINTNEAIAVDSDYLMLKKDLNAFESFKSPTKDSVAILPQWDSYTMGYAPDGRERFVSPDMQHHVYAKIGATGGNARGVVLVNGEAHAAWDSKFAGTKMTVKLDMFEKPSDQMGKIVEKKFHEIATLLKAKSVVLEM